MKRPERYYLIPLSARSEGALKARREQLAEWLEEEGEAYSLGDIAYTLLVGRTHFPVRQAFLVRTVEELKQLLREGDPGHLPAPAGVDEAEGRRLLEELGGEPRRAELEVLAGLYTAGASLDWARLYRNGRPRRVPLPGYPFERERCWVSETAGAPAAASGGRLHALLDRAGAGDERTFLKRFTPGEFFLRDHVVGVDKVLPGVVQLEMARAAGDLARPGASVRTIRDVLWLQPVSLTPEATHADVTISLSPTDVPHEVAYRVCGGADGQTLHSQGTLVYGSDRSGEPAPRLDLEAVRDRCPRRLEGAECVQRFRTRGLHLGPTFRAIRELWVGSGEVLARLELPAEASDTAGAFTLHPSLLDGALESVIGLVAEAGEPLSLPYAVDAMTLLQQLPPACWAYARLAEETEAARKFDVQIVAEDGQLLVDVKGFSLRKPAAGARPVEGELLLGSPRWEAAAPVAGGPPEGDVLLFDTDLRLFEVWSERSGPGRPLAVLPGESFREVSERVFEINPLRADDYRSLFQALARRGVTPRHLVHRWSRGSLFEKEADPPEQSFLCMLRLVQAVLGTAWAAPVRLLYVYPFQGGSPRPVDAGMGGFARAVNAEQGRLLCRTVGVPPSMSDASLLELLHGELQADPADVEVRHGAEGRLVRRVVEVAPASGGLPVPYKEDGVYLITGGLGALGLAVARDIAGAVRCTLILAGRTAPGPEQEHRLAELRGLGAEVRFLRCDVSREDEVGGMIGAIRESHGHIDGIIHCAGVIRDALLTEKEEAEARAVIGPKARGAVYLDRATREEPLDFFVLFSSVASVAGNRGQCDYAFANGFMDGLAHEREALRRQGLRSGRTVAINWPLWEEGGMQVDEPTRALFAGAYGMVPLDTPTGLRALRLALAGDEAQLVLARGDLAKLRRALGMGEDRQRPDGASPGGDARPDRQALVAEVFGGLSQIVSDMLRVKPKDIAPGKSMSEYGFNSLTLTDFVNRVNERYGLTLTPAVFFEHSTLGSFAEFLAREHSDRLRWVVAAPGSSEQPEPAASPEPQAQPAEPVAQAPPAPAVRSADEPIAIVGMSGIFPQSDDLEEFWENLVAARNLVTEIPADRWDWREYYSETNEGINKTWAKWGGFIREVDKFDHAFFRISPREAGLMDPQQRLFLQTVWKCIEDAGHNPRALAGTRTGLFVGVSTYDYYDLLKDAGVPIEAHVSTGLSHCVLANRISYLLDFRGPSEPIDTACSSSLIAIHRAVESIRNGDCEMAVAGGVNLMLSPMLFIAFGKAGMLSPDGACKTFDKRANGYVRGEGCAAVFLKPLSRALQDGDHIYALIRSTAVNHGGHANTLTTPNPNAQEELLVRAYEKAGIDPATVTYIEAHGTGTRLGDPVEVNGLRKAFDRLRRQRGEAPVRQAYCGLGAVKANIGHLEAAAGIAGVIKVVLAMQHKVLPGNPHFQELNPYIQLEGSPFYIVDRTRAWEPLHDDAGRPLPRRAGVSSFGFGGANAHVVLEEYPGQAAPAPRSSGPQLLVLSARNEGRLRASAGNLARWLQRRAADCAPAADQEAIRQELAGTLAGLLHVAPADIAPDDDFEEFGLDVGARAELARSVLERYGLDVGQDLLGQITTLAQLAAHIAAHRAPQGAGGTPDLASVAYTLQVGREAMDERLALVVESVEEAVDRLGRYARGEQGVAGLFTGRAGRPAEDVHLPEEPVRYTPGGDLAELARLWVNGAEVDWRTLHPDPPPRRMPLPTYPFEPRRHWFKAPAQAAPPAAAAPVHPPAAVPPPAEGAIDWAAKATAYQGDEVTLEVVDGSIAVVTMQDRQNRNMFSEALVTGLIARFAEIQRNPAIKAIIVTGYDNVFCMGGTQEQLLGIAANRNQFTDIPFLYRGLLEASVPVIAAIQGHASGGGLLFGLYADIVVMAEEGIYSAVFTKYGFTPGMGATWVLREKLGANLATEMMYTARSYKGEELRQRGASVLFRPRSQVLSEALTLARTLAEKPAHTLRVLKQALSRRALEQLPTHIELEAQMHRETFSHPEVIERINYYFQRTASAVAASRQVPADPGPEPDPDPLDELLRRLEAGEITPEQATVLRQKMRGAV